MVITAPAPATAATPAGAPAPTRPPAPAGAPAPQPAKTGAAQPPQQSQQGSQPAPGDAAAAKQAILDKLQKTGAMQAMAEVDAMLAKLATMTVGGGTPEGTQNAKMASAMLTDASMLLQHAHTRTIEQMRTIAAEMHLKLMSSVSGLAFLGGQLAMAGQSKTPVKLAEVAATSITDTRSTMAEVAAVLQAAAQKTPPAAGSVPTPPAPNGNGGVAAGTGAPPAS